VDNGKVYNTALLIDPSGQELARYQKVHLFDVNLPDGNTYRESSTVMAGTQLPQVYPSSELGTLGLSVCYDVLPRTLPAPSIRELISCLSQLPSLLYRQGPLASATQARAIENTCYVIAPAQTGQHYALRQSHGHA